MDPATAEQTAKLARTLIDDARAVFTSPEIQSGLQNVLLLINRARNFEALKTLRSLFPLEAKEMAAEAGLLQSPPLERSLQ